MKKEYHGIRIDWIEIPLELIITSSAGNCVYTTNYLDLTYEFWEACQNSEPEKIIEPRLYNAAN